MRVKDVMTNKVVSVSPQTTVAEALDTMVRSHLSGLPVIDESGSLVGIVSEADFLRRSELGTQKPESSWFQAMLLPGRAAEIYARAHGRLVSEIMIGDVVTVEENDSLADAVALMEKRRVKRLPVVADGRVVGMITRADFVRALAEFVRQPYDEEPFAGDEEIKSLIEAELQSQAWAPVASINIAVKSGIVDLRGVVADERQRTAIRAVAENVYGVRAVHDHIDIVQPLSGVF